MRANSEFAQSKRRDRGLFRHARDRGSTLIEAALVLPIILLVVLGTVEIGMAFKDFLTAGSLSREGARIAALAGNTDEADCFVLEGIGQLATQGDLEKLISIQIYKAAEGTGNPVPGKVNTWTYDGGDPSKCSVPPDTGDNWSNPSGQNYTAGERNTTIGGTSLDIVGVRVTIDHNWITGFPPFRGGFTIDETTITRVEPEAFE